MSLAGWTHILSHACQVVTVPFSWTLTQSHGKTSLWNWDSGHNLKQHLKLWCNFWTFIPSPPPLAYLHQNPQTIFLGTCDFWQNTFQHPYSSAAVHT